MGDLGALRSFTLLAVLGDAGLPRRFVNAAKGQGHVLGKREADRVLEVPIPKGLDELMGTRGRVGPGQHPLALNGIRSLRPYQKLCEGVVQDGDLIRRGVGAGVAGPQHPRQGLLGPVEVDEERVVG